MRIAFISLLLINNSEFNFDFDSTSDSIFDFDLNSSYNIVYSFVNVVLSSFNFFKILRDSLYPLFTY